MKLPDAALVWGGAAALLVAGFWLAFQFVDPAPPSVIRMATGAPDGAYHRYAERYREPLEAQGITLELVPSEGAVANLDLLTREQDPVDLAFVQGGVPTQGLGEVLSSLGSLYFEPVWVFLRDAAVQAPRTLKDLQGLRIGIGGAGSGTQAVARTLLEANGIGAGRATLLEVDFQRGATALAAGDIDALFVIASPTAAIVHDLATRDGVSIMNFARADAYVRLYRFMSHLDLPEGVVDLAANRPPAPVSLLAVTANLVARNDFHPALTDLVLQVARQVHQAPGILEEADQFPSPRYAILPLDDDAERFYRYGPPFLQRYLPFWPANLLDRLKIMLLPLIALLFPLLKTMPPLYQWRIRSRVYRWYDDLQKLDPARAAQPPDAASLAARLQALDALESEVNQVQVPLSYTDELYHLRSHIELVRHGLEERRRQLHADASPATDASSATGVSPGTGGGSAGGEIHT